MVNSVRAETYPRKPAIRNGFRAFLRLLAMFLLLAVAGGTGASGGTPTPLQQLILDYLSAHSLPLTPKGIAAGAKLAGVSVFDIGEAFGLTPNQSSAWLSNPANATCPGDCVCTAPGPCAAKTWTVMIYMAGDNNLSDTALLNLNQMKSANSSANVRVVVLVEFSPTYTPGVSSNTLYGTVTNGSADLQSVGQNIDMGNRQSLRDFVRWAKGTYPADHYALVLWSHGGGWKDRSLVRGALDDESSHSIMPIADIAGAIEEAGGVDLINFDACFMAMYEVAYELRNAAKFLVASETTVPGPGNPYDMLINRLVFDPDQTTADFAGGMVEDFFRYYGAVGHESVQNALIDLSHMAQVHEKAQQVAALLTSGMDLERVALQSARDAAPYYADGNNVDLARFADALSMRAADPTLRGRAAELAAAARAAVLATRVYTLGDPSLNQSTGLAIFVPSPGQVSSRDIADYGALLASNRPANAVAGGVSWQAMVAQLVSGSSTGGTLLSLTQGNFAYGISWDNPAADLDLLVNEPRGKWAGPSVGASSSNAFSSTDSYYTGGTAEYYIALPQVEQGEFFVFVRYIGCAQGYASCGPTTVTVYRYDPRQGDSSYTPIATRLMDHSPALPALSGFGSWSPFLSAVASGSYSDWLYAQSATPQPGIASPPLSPLPKALVKALTAIPR